MGGPFVLVCSDYDDDGKVWIQVSDPFPTYQDALKSIEGVEGVTGIMNQSTGEVTLL